MREFTVTHEKGVAKIAIPKRLDLHNRQELRGVADHQLQKSNVVLDFAACETVDSSGCGALVSINNVAQERKRQFKVVGARAEVMELFRHYRVHQVITIEVPTGAPVGSRS